MVEYPRALRIAYRILYFHPADAQDYVAGKLAEAVHAANDEQAAEWRKVGHFVERLLGESALPQAPVPPRPHPPRRYRRLRAAGPR